MRLPSTSKWHPTGFEALVFKGVGMFSRFMTLEMCDGCPHMFYRSYFRTLKRDQVSYSPPQHKKIDDLVVCLGCVQTNKTCLVSSTSEVERAPVVVPLGESVYSRL